MIIKIKLNVKDNIKNVIFTPIAPILKNIDLRWILSENLPSNGGKTNVVNMKKVNISWIRIMFIFKFNKYLGKYAKTPIPEILAIKTEIKVNITDFLDNINFFPLIYEI